MSLTGKTKASSYKDILQMNNSNSGVDTATRPIVDGEGTASVLAMSDDNLYIQPNNDDTTALLKVRAKGGASLLVVDSANSLVKAGAGQHIVNTQFKTFGLWNFLPTADEHHPMTTIPMITSTSDSDFTGEVNGSGWGGTSTNPATSLTISSASLELIPSLWVLQQDITIDEIQYVISSSAASTIGLKLMAYDMVAGALSTSGDLSSGTLIASLTAVVTGDDRITNGTISPSTSNQDDNKVLVLFAQSSDTDKVTIQTTIKYHLR
tara:strand:- start:612 stop:1406 length:795 start_codon:yes stop_codon:yes gene_type:complete